MQEKLLDIFHLHPQAAILISLLASIFVAVLGLIPSVFITAANILFFGFWPGMFISLAGETLGAIVAFILYRSGFRKISHHSLSRFPRLLRLIDSRGSEAFLLIIALRLIPFVPSGLVTFAAAIGKVTSPVFIIASTVGKIPSLLIEAYSVTQIAEFSWQGKLILVVSAVALIAWLIRSTRNAS